MTGEAETAAQREAFAALADAQHELEASYSAALMATGPVAAEAVARYQQATIAFHAARAATFRAWGAKPPA